MRHCKIVFHIANTRRRAIHSERIQNSAADKVGPFHSRDFFHYPTCRNEHQILIAVTRAKIRNWFEISDAANDLIGRIGRVVPKQIAAKGIQAGTMADNISDSYLCRDPWVIHLKVRQVLYYLVVPVELTFVHKYGEARRCKSLRI